MAKKYLDDNGLRSLWAKILEAIENFFNANKNQLKGDKGDTGSSGKDGVSCTHSWNGTTLTVTSASGTSSANLKGEKGDTGSQGPAGKDGSNGSTPVKGVDYFTAADKTEIVNSTVSAINEQEIYAPKDEYLEYTLWNNYEHEALDTKIEEIQDNIGTLTNLSTSEQSNLVGSINELYNDIANQGIEMQNLGIDLTREDNLIREDVGTLSNLTTTEKSNLVGSINELNNKIDDSAYTTVGFIRLNLSSDFSVTTATFTPIKYTKKTIFEGTDFVSVDSAGTITITESGVYLISPATAFNANTTGGRYHDIYDNAYLNANAASSSVGISGVRTCFSSNCILQITDDMIANGKNTFIHRAYQTSGSTLTLATTGTFLNIVKLKTSMYANVDEVSY